MRAALRLARQRKIDQQRLRLPVVQQNVLPSAAKCKTGMKGKGKAQKLTPSRNKQENDAS